MTLFVAYFLLVAIAVHAVSRSGFRTCSSSPHCNRYKQFAQENNHPPSWSVLGSSIRQTSDGVFGFELTNIAPSSPCVPNTTLTGVLEIFDVGAARLLLDEVDPQANKTRFRLRDEDALSRSNSKFPRHPKDIAVTESNVEQIGKVWSASWRTRDHRRVTIQIVLQPFQVSLFDGDERRLTLNKHRLLNFEVNRSKDLAACNHSRDATGLRGNDTAGLWSTSFSGHLDEMANGPMGVGIDIDFLGWSSLHGLPEHTVDFDLPDRFEHEQDIDEPYRFYNADVYMYELNTPMTLYASIPFLVATHAMKERITGVSGILWMNPSETFVKLDRSREKATSWWSSETGVLELLLLSAPNLEGLTQQYTQFTGYAALPPGSALGLHQSRWNYQNQNEVKEINDKYDEFGIPLDYVWLDIDHSQHRKYFTWNDHFPEPRAMLRDLKSKMRHLVVIVDPHTKHESGYAVHDKLVEQDLLIKKSDGSIYTGWCWPGDSVYPDVLRRELMTFYESFYKSWPKLLDSTPSISLSTNTGSPTKEFGEWEAKFYNLGIWNDMNEPSVFNGPEVSLPRYVRHLNGTVEAREVHNLYGVSFHRASYESQLNRGDDARPFVLTRSTFIGGQRYGAIWTGDNQANYEHMRNSIPVCLSFALSGYSFVGADVGGFFNEPTSELMLKWLQLAAWLPFFRVHSTLGTTYREIYLLPEREREYARTAVIERYRLHPLFYTAMAKHHFEGIPIFTSVLDFEIRHNAGVSKAFKQQDAFIVDDSIFVRPHLYAAAEVSENEPHPAKALILPSAIDTYWWYYWNPRVRAAAGNEIIVGEARDPVPQYAPVFVRSGKILIRKERQRRSIEAARFDPYTLCVYLHPSQTNQTAAGTLYIDDMKSQSSVNNGEGVFIDICWNQNATGGTLKLCNPPRGKQPDSKLITDIVERIRIFGIPTARVVRLDHQQDLQFRMSGSAAWEIKVPPLAISLMDPNWTLEIQF